MLKLELAIAMAAIVGGTLWIEQAHRVVIDAPAAADMQSSAAGACPENDTRPYDARCLDFLDVPAERPRLRVVVTVRDAQSAEGPAACPDKDKAPYSPACIAYLTGATETGMRWRVTGEPLSTPQ